MQADISGGNGEKKTVCPVEHPTVSRDKIREVLNSYHPFHKRLGQISYLPHSGGNQSCNNTKPERQGCGEITGKEEINQDSRGYGGESSANAALDSFVWTDGGSYLVFTKEHTAKKGKTVADPGGQASQNQCLKPDVTHTYTHYYCKQKAGIAEPGQGKEGTLASNFFMDYPGE